MHWIIKKIKNINPVSRVLVLLLLVVIALTIGYSTAADRLSVSDIKAMARTTADIRITGLRVANISNSGQVDHAEFSVDNIMSDISLPDASSSVTYEVWVTNFGNIEMGIVDILNLPNNLDYEFSGYTLDTALCDYSNPTECTLRSVSKFFLTIQYGENGYDGVTTDFSLNFDFDFEEMHYVARIGNQKYTTLNAAVTAVPTDNTETTIVLLKNTIETVIVTAGKNIVLDFPNLVLSGDGLNPVFVLRGSTLKIENGTIFTDSGQAAINVETDGYLIMTGGRIVSYGTKQAVYVDNGGTATISGTASLTAEALVENNNKRGTVQTKSGGTLNILGGTIEAIGTNGIAVSNAGIVNIGTKGDSVSTTSPAINGVNYGLYLSGGVGKIYDGLIKGKTLAIYNENLVIETETNYAILHGTETIDGDTYDTASLAPGVTVTFDPNQGSVSPNKKTVVVGQPVGSLPTPTRTDYRFDGWFTTQNVKVTTSTIVTEATVYTAHWTKLDYVAQVDNDHKYTSVTSAISAAANGGTVYLIKNTSEQVIINAGKTVNLDLQSYTLSNNGAKSVLEILGGNVTLVGGAISTNTTQGAVNVKNGGSFTMTAGTITATGNRQALYVEDGSATISGTAYLTSKAQVESGKMRGTVQTVGTSTLVVLGGTIVSEGRSNDGIAISNEGTTTIGTDDGNISITSPVIQGYKTGVYNSGTMYYYDGIIKARTTLFGGAAPIININTTIVSGSETILGTTYETAILN